MGDVYIGSSGYVINIKDDFYIGGVFDIRLNGYVIFGKNFYVYGDMIV